MNHIHLSLECNHSRETRSTYDSHEVKHPERWIGTLAQCDQCNRLRRVVAIAKTEKWLETFMGVLAYVEREGKRRMKRKTA